MATGSSLGDISNKTVKAKSIKQLLGQTATRNPALENAMGMGRRIDTSRTRADRLFGGGGGIPNMTAYTKPDGTIGTRIGWANRYVDGAIRNDLPARGSGMRGTEGSYNTASQPITAPVVPPGAPPPGPPPPPPPPPPGAPPVVPGPGIVR